MDFLYVSSSCAFVTISHVVLWDLILSHVHARVHMYRSYDLGKSAKRYLPKEEALLGRSNNTSRSSKRGRNALRNKEAILLCIEDPRSLSDRIPGNLNKSRISGAINSILSRSSMSRSFLLIRRKSSLSVGSADYHRKEKDFNISTVCLAFEIRKSK